MVWRSGLSEWMPWEKAAAQDEGGDRPAAPEDAVTPGTRVAMARKATVAAAPAILNKAPAEPRDELESFMGEISALEVAYPSDLEKLPIQRQPSCRFVIPPPLSPQGAGQ